MTRHHRTAAVVLSGAAILALPAATASAAGTAPADRTSQQRVLGGVVGGLLGGTTGGTTTVVEPDAVTTLVDQLAGTVGGTLGLDSTELTATVTDLLESGVAPDADLLGALLTTAAGTVTDTTQVTDLVTDLLGSGVLPLDVVTVVDELLATIAPTADVSGIVDSVVGDLLAVGLPTDTVVLDGIVAALLGGAAPTGTLLEPLAALLDTLAANAVLPADLRTSISDLSSGLRSAGGGAVPTDVLGAVSGLLDGLLDVANLNKPVSDALGQLSGLIVKPQSIPPVPGPGPGGGSTAPPSTGPGTNRSLALTTAMRARVRKVKVDKGRKVVKATLSCPAAAVYGCAVSSRLRVAGRPVGKSYNAIMKPGATRTIALKVPAAVTRRLLRRGGTVGVRATSALGKLQPTASRSISVRRTVRR